MATSGFVRAVAIAFALVGLGAFAEPLDLDVELPGGQRRLSFQVRVVDEAGAPVAGSVIRPWALLSPRGHGSWREGDKPALLSPQESTTDDRGEATIDYPEFRELDGRGSRDVRRP